MAPHELVLVLALAAVVAVAVLPPPGAVAQTSEEATPTGRPTASPEGRIDVSNQKLRCLYLPGVKSSTESPPPSYIDGSNNLLTEVGDNTLTGLFLLRYLNLSGNLLHEWGRYPFKDLRSLQLLDLSRNQYRNVDRVVLEPLQALRRLNLSSNRIQYLDAAAFPRLERLHDLDLTRNDMEVIADDAFARLGALQRLDLRWNRLSTLGERTLRGLTAVQSVLLGGNIISEAMPGALQGLDSLSEISLADNGQVVDLVLVGNRLQRVDLSRIGLSAMPAALTRSVRALVLPGNNVRIISCGDLDSFPLLQALELSGNGLALIEDDALGRLEQLETLVLRNNSLMMIPPSLPESLVSLQLQHNQIRHIGANDLRGLRRLERIDLSSNQVHHIHDGAFRFLESLVELDLSDNKLLELRAAALAGPVGLRTLRLAHLGDITAPAKWLPFPIERPERLQSLDLDQSPQLARQLLADTAALMAMPHLQVLRLGSDELHHLRPDLPRLLSHLTQLRLADNPWHCSGLRWLPRWLQTLDKESATNATCRQPAEVAGLKLRNLTAAHFNSSHLDDGDEEDPPPPLALPLAAASPDEEVSIPINEYKRLMIELNKTLAREAAASSTPGPGLVGSGKPVNVAVNPPDDLAVNLTVPVATEGTEVPPPPPVAAALSAASTQAVSTTARTATSAPPKGSPGPPVTVVATTSATSTSAAVTTKAGTFSTRPASVPTPQAMVGTSTTAMPATTASLGANASGTPTNPARATPTTHDTTTPPATPTTDISTSPKSGPPSATTPKGTLPPTLGAIVTSTSTSAPSTQTTPAGATGTPTPKSKTASSNTPAPTSKPVSSSTSPPTSRPVSSSTRPPASEPASSSSPPPTSTPPARASTAPNQHAVNAAGVAGVHEGRGELVVASSLRHGAGHVETVNPRDTVSRHTTSVVAMFAVAVCCSVAVLLAFAIARNSRQRRQQLLRLHSMEDLVLRGRGPDAECPQTNLRDHGLGHAPELW